MRLKPLMEILLVPDHPRQFRLYPYTELYKPCTFYICRVTHNVTIQSKINDVCES